MLKRPIACACALLAGGQLALATQNNLIPPTTGVYTGVQFSNLLGDAFRSLASSNSGSSPAANVNGSVVKGLWWLDTSVTPNLLKFYTGTNYVPVAAVDEANALWSPPFGGGKGELTAASTTDLGSRPQAYIEITGTTPIDSFGSTAPAYSSKLVKFLSATPLNYSSALPVPGGYNLTVDAGTRALVTHLGSGNWEFASLTRANGVPIDISAVGKIGYAQTAAAPELHVLGYGQALTRSSYPAYLAKVTRAQNGTRVSGNATITSVADTSGMGAGMPVEGTGLTGCTIASVTSSTIVLSSGACVGSSGTATVTVFLTGYGSGGSTSTVGVPDCGGRMLAGRDDPNGTALGRITNAGSGIVGTQKNAAGGGQSVTLAQSALPNVTLTLAVQPSVAVTTGGVGVLGVQSGSANVQVAAGVFANVFAAGTYGAIVATTSGGSTSSINGNVTQTAVNKMPPALIADCVVRVLP